MKRYLLSISTIILGFNVAIIQAGPLEKIVRKGSSDYYYMANPSNNTVSVKSCKVENRINSNAPVYLHIEESRNLLFVIGTTEISMFDIKNPTNPILIKTEPTNVRMIGKVYLEDVANIIHIEDLRGKEYTFNPRDLAPW